MRPAPNAALHDAYAADYDAQVRAYACQIGDLLFGLCYEFIPPGQRQRCFVGDDVFVLWVASRRPSR